MTFPRALPHGPIEQVFDDVFVVQGAVGLPIPLPARMTRTMTIVRQGDALTLFNSMRLSRAGLRNLDAVGRVTSVVRIGGFHGRDDGFFRDRYGAKILAIKGHKYTRTLRSDASTPGYLEPDVHLESGATLPIDSASLVVLGGTPPEGVVLIGREGGILLTADALQNVPEPDAFVNFLGRTLMKRAGFFQSYGLGPGWLKASNPPLPDIVGLLDLPFEHVLPGHGRPVIGRARERYRPAIERHAAELASGESPAPQSVD